MMTPEQNTERGRVLTDAHHDFEKGLNARAFFKLSDHELGEGLVQDTFLKTWTYLVKGGKIEIMKAFLYHVLNNLIVDQYRKHKTISLDALFEKGFDRSVGDTNRLFDILDGKVAVVLIKQLPEIYRKALQMRYIQDLTLEEMSLLTGKTKNALAVEIHRGLEKLKILYEGGARA